MCDTLPVAPLAVPNPTCDAQHNHIGPNVLLPSTMVAGGPFNIRRECSHAPSISGWGAVPLNSQAAFATRTPLNQGCAVQMPFSETSQQAVFCMANATQAAETVYSHPIQAAQVYQYLLSG